MIYCLLNTSSENIGGFDLWAIPRIGDRIYVSFHAMLADEKANPGKYTEEALAKWRKWNGQTVEVDTVHHDLTMAPMGGGDHTVRIFVTRRAK